MSDTLTGVDGRPLSSRGERTRRRLLEAAETVFAELGYHDASIVKLTEAAGVGQGTFYLYFSSRGGLRRARRRPQPPCPPGDDRGSLEGKMRAEMERLGFAGVLPLCGRAPGALSDHSPGRVRLPEILQLHYERLTSGYVVGLEQAMEAVRSSRATPSSSDGR